MTRILVTGAAGSIGRAVLRVVSSRRLEFVTHRGLIDGDLTDPATARAVIARDLPDLVVNAAGASYGDAPTLWRANVLLPLRLLDAIHEVAPAARVVLLGSAAEYGLTGPGTRLREDHPCEPNSAYGHSKLAATMLANALGTSSVVVARLFNLVSLPHEPRSLLGRLAADYAAGNADPIGAEAVRDFVPIEEAAEALVDLGLASSSEPVVNVCTGVAQSAAAALGRTTSHAPGPWAVGNPSLLESIIGRRLRHFGAERSRA